MENKITGSCLCGGVTYQYTGPVKLFQHCFCTRCQKVSGSAHAANIIIDPAHFEWLSGKDLLGRYEVPEAKHFATSFCKNCGSTLPWLTQSSKAMIIPAGSLDHDPKVRPQQNIYFSNKAPWYVDVDSLPKHDELPKK